jgi:hypothetical protein
MACDHGSSLHQQVTPKFRHEGLETLNGIIKRGDFMTKGDIKHVLPHTNQGGVSQIPGISIRKQVLPVQGNAYGVFIKPISFQSIAQVGWLW